MLKSRAKKIGNSFMITIPKAVCEEWDIEKDHQIEYKIIKNHGETKKK